MKQLTLEWIAKAEEDFSAAIALARLRKQVLPNAVCFHSQQCAEKYLKAHLQEAGLPVPKIHDLTFLLQRLIPVDPIMAALHSNLLRLTDYGVDFRYPGHQATQQDAKSALRDCRTVRREIQAHAWIASLKVKSYRRTPTGLSVTGLASRGYFVREAPPQTCGSAARVAVQC